MKWRENKKTKERKERRGFKKRKNEGREVKEGKDKGERRKDGKRKRGGEKEWGREEGNERRKKTSSAQIKQLSLPFPIKHPFSTRERCLPTTALSPAATCRPLAWGRGWWGRAGARDGMTMGRGRQDCASAGLGFLFRGAEAAENEAGLFISKSLGLGLREEGKRERRVSQGETREGRSDQLQVSTGRRENSPVLTPAFIIFCSCPPH